MSRGPFRTLPVRPLAPLATLGAAFALAGCQVLSPVATEASYAPADGVPVDLGTVQIRDLLVIADAKGGPGVLSGSLVNTGTTTERVTIEAEGAPPITLSSPPNRAERLSGSPQAQLSQVPVEPGSVVQLRISAGTAGTSVVEVPVLPPVGYYETLKPTSAATATTTAP